MLAHRIHRAGHALLAVALSAAVSGCAVENRYYVRTDGSADVLHGVDRLSPPAAQASSQAFDLGVTFKSAGKVSAGASDQLYHSVSQGLAAKGQWQLHRVGGADEDFEPEIAAVIHAPAGSAVPSLVEMAQRMLVLVENTPDLASGTQINYFLSGMTFGVHSLLRPTDRYEVTIAYRDPRGLEHVYHSHQDLLFATGNKLLGTEQAAAALRPYDTAMAAFDGIVGNSLNGTRQGHVTVGTPQMSP
jgi:hypothetical protein